MPKLIDTHDPARRVGSAEGNNLVTSFSEHKRAVSFSGAPVVVGSAAEPAGGSAALYVETVTFRANVCRSLLSVDVDELYFDECLPGNTYIKDFTVWNRSEIPLWFRLQSSAPDFSVIDCTLFDTNERISADGQRVANYSHCHIRVTFKAQDVGEDEYSLEIENVNDERNIETITVHSVTTRGLNREGISIREKDSDTPGGCHVVDFGDCYSGLAVAKRLVVKNNGQKPVHIWLSSDCTDEISFELLTEIRNLQAPHAADGSISAGIIDSSTANEERERSMDGADSGQAYPLARTRSSSFHGAFPEDADLNEVVVEAKRVDEWEQRDGSGSMTPHENGSDGMMIQGDSGGGEETYTKDDDDDDDDDEEDEADEDDDVMNATVDDGDDDERDDDEDDEDDEDDDDDDDDREEDRAEELQRRGRTQSIGEENDGDPSVINRHLTKDQKKRAPAREHQQARGAGRGAVYGALASSTSASRSGDEPNVLARNDAVKIEDLNIAPGMERILTVWFHPAERELESLESRNEGSSVVRSSGIDNVHSAERSEALRLTGRKMRISVKYYEFEGAWHRERVVKNKESFIKTLSVRARICTSFVAVNPPTLNFGDCNVGEYKALIVKVTNLADLPAAITTESRLKSVTFPTKTVNIPPHKSIDLKVEFVPRKIAADFKHKILVHNQQNRSNICPLEVVANTMDSHHVVFHSRFYRVHINNKYQAPQVYCGKVVANSNVVRAFSFENITKGPLSLQLFSSTPSEIQLFTVSTTSAPRLADNLLGEDMETVRQKKKREQWLDSLEDSSGKQTRPHYQNWNSSLTLDRPLLPSDREKKKPAKGAAGEMIDANTIAKKRLLQPARRRPTRSPHKHSSRGGSVDLAGPLKTSVDDMQMYFLEKRSEQKKQRQAVQDGGRPAEIAEYSSRNEPLAAIRDRIFGAAPSSPRKNFVPESVKRMIAAYEPPPNPPNPTDAEIQTIVQSRIQRHQNLEQMIKEGILVPLTAPGEQPIIKATRAPQQSHSSTSTKPLVS
jgi:hypothetical protein